MTITRRIVTSSNWDTGRGGKPVSGIVLHTMVGYMQGSENRFADPSSQVSVHYGIGMDGSIRQWVDEANTAWQAGNYAVNQTTIGIEHEDFANPNDVTRTAALYEASSNLVADICRRYNFPADSGHIFLHKGVIDTSRYPGGTGCPDGLDTSRIIRDAATRLRQGGNEVIPTKDLLTALFMNMRGRAPNPEEVDAYVGKITYNDFIPILNSGNEHDAWVTAGKTGQVAIRDNWQGQIGTLQKQLAAKATVLTKGLYSVQ